MTVKLDVAVAYPNLSQRYRALFVDMIIMVLGGTLFASGVTAVRPTGHPESDGALTVACILLVGLLNDVGVGQARGGSVGKLLNGLEVRRGVGSTGALRLAIRFLLKVPIFMSGLGELSFYLSARRQGLHDQMTGVTVVSTR